ncbi:hypothetical protein SISNIDRAFT_355504 [Sistotremastrum niveocremeum HHB9708]|uniref:Uncharacterized protein n=1 Tax=Sistotremastrum niveocremeum HHB9708 TaxID=1314777 RepID=A0A164MDD6_9AGAM|nr:hypothetical protein SISNIDRAFT_355504 [Sistotremastrum niveocremeum HHB9708]
MTTILQPDEPWVRELRETQARLFREEAKELEIALGEKISGGSLHPQDREQAYREYSRGMKELSRIHQEETAALIQAEIQARNWSVNNIEPSDDFVKEQQSIMNEIRRENARARYVSRPPSREGASSRRTSRPTSRQEQYNPHPLKKKNLLPHLRRLRHHHLHDLRTDPLLQKAT